MITKEQALQIALDHLTNGLRHRLEVSPGWPPEAPLGWHARSQDDQHLLLDIPKALRNPDADRRKAPEAPVTVPAEEREEPPCRVWRVYVPGGRLAVGSSRYIVIDQETGEVLADGRYGE
ncbi:MAG TPA: hypothetical protein VFX20_15540 [Steroidobacteraceae bacterium]|nr:hypothetical protein [Steroidobacteraceae bacterium]